MGSRSKGCLSAEFEASAPPLPIACCSTTERLVLPCRRSPANGFESLAKHGSCSLLCKSASSFRAAAAIRAGAAHQCRAAIGAACADGCARRRRTDLVRRRGLARGNDRLPAEWKRKRAAAPPRRAPPRIVPGSLVVAGRRRWAASLRKTSRNRGYSPREDRRGADADSPRLGLEESLDLAPCRRRIARRPRSTR